MKWYYWLLIAAVIITIIVLMIRNNKKNQEALAQIAANTSNDNEFDPFSLSQISKTTS